MENRLCHVVDPIFERGIQLLEEMETGKSLDHEREQSFILELFSTADEIYGDDVSWRLARYALASWIDELCVSVPWSGAEWWQSNILEMKLFQTRICSRHFFELAKQSVSFHDKQALEVFYCCVLLGFRGMYGDPESIPQKSSGQTYPATLSEWLEETGRRLQTVVPPAYQPSPMRCVTGAPPLSGRRNQIVWSMVFVFLLVLNATLVTLVWDW
ncbi:MAG: DotU family type IV/VI secretion system protein [Pirellula sp.]|jgi:type VI secretion system protein ImpK|nr:DotU family type IV/VI secretion system protein [Pirellula sp.]